MPARLRSMMRTEPPLVRVRGLRNAVRSAAGEEHQTACRNDESVDAREVQALAPCLTGCRHARGWPDPYTRRRYATGSGQPAAAWVRCRTSLRRPPRDRGIAR